MNICVFGLWHLGSVTAACLASRGHRVHGLDFDPLVIEGLQRGQPPLFEPGLGDLTAAGLREGLLSYTSDAALALAQAQLVWVTHDTPVDEDDQADTGFVIEQVYQAMDHSPAGCVFLISSQLPVGSVAALERHAMAHHAERRFGFACSPENLRLGQALEVFLKPDRIVVGVRTAQARTVLEPLLGSISERIEWMSVESAEMTKHAINAFLAMSVAFANELATLCESVGADAKQVERGLKTEQRIGPRAYLGPGAAFAGGTLARDIGFLTAIGQTSRSATPLLSAVRTSNDHHRQWAQRALTRELGELDGLTIAVWGLTYKPGTDTLRRSMSVELVDWLIGQGARLRVHDPAVKSLPAAWADSVVRCATPLATLQGASALAVCTPWPDYRALDAAAIAKSVPDGFPVIDAARHLVALAAQAGLRHVAVGTPGARGGRA
jgi:UDPglucose 6-dehydrogenase